VPTLSIRLIVTEVAEVATIKGRGASEGSDAEPTPTALGGIGDVNAKTSYQMLGRLNDRRADSGAASIVPYFRECRHLP